MSISLQSPSSLTGPRPHMLPRPAGKTWSRKVFSFCLLFIVCVSIYDTYLVAFYRETILMDERNPICEYLIRQDVGQLTWFIGGKLVGNLVVVSTLVGLVFSGFSRALTVAKGVASFQLLLLCYLHFSDPLTGVLHFDGFLSDHPPEFRRSVLSAMIHLGVVVPTLMGGVYVRRRWESMRAMAIR